MGWGLICTRRCRTLNLTSCRYHHLSGTSNAHVGVQVVESLDFKQAPSTRHKCVAPTEVRGIKVGPKSDLVRGGGPTGGGTEGCQHDLGWGRAAAGAVALVAELTSQESQPREYTHSVTVLSNSRTIYMMY